MNDIIQMQMNRDNQSVGNQHSQTIDDILSKHKVINKNKNDITDKIKNINKEQIITNNEIITKENNNVINKPIKKSCKNIFPIIIQAFLGSIVLFDFIYYLFSKYVRNILLLYN